MPLLPVVELPEGKTVASPDVKRDLAKVDAELERALPGARIASYPSTGDRAFVSRDGHTVYALVYPTGADRDDFGTNIEAARKARAALAATTVGGAPVRVTGFDALADESGGDNDGPGVLAEAIVGGLGALVVLLFVFASVLALVPLVIAVVSIMTSFVLLLGLTEITTVSPVVQFLIALIGLGVAIDYALLVVSRWREERTHGCEGDEAVQRAMESAGRSVVFSGLTVAIGLFALFRFPCRSCARWATAGC